MDDFVIRGEPMRDEQAECPYEAREVDDLRPPAVRARLGRAEGGAGRLRRARPTRSSEAEQRQARAGRPARRASRRSSPWPARTCRSGCPPARTARIRDLDEKGAEQAAHATVRSPASGGAVALGGSGAVTRRRQGAQAGQGRHARPEDDRAREAAARRQGPADAEGARRLEGRRHLRDGRRQAHRLPQAAGRHGQAAGQAPLRLRGRLGERGGRAEGAAPSGAERPRAARGSWWGPGRPRAAHGRRRARSDGGLLGLDRLAAREQQPVDAGPEQRAGQRRDDEQPQLLERPAADEQRRARCCAPGSPTGW